MRHFVLPGQPQGGRIEIDGKDFHYLAHVRRLGSGDSFAATDGAGRRWRCTVLTVGHRSLQAGMEELPGEQDGAQEGGARITLIQALPKSRKMDLIVRQATEAGVWALRPVLSRHSEVRLAAGQEGGAEGGARMARWLRVAREAVQQSGRSRMPLIADVADLVSAVQTLPDDGSVRLLAHQPAAEGWEAAGQSLHQCLAGEVGGVVLAVGPEGGFAEEEIRFLRERGFLPVTFGGTVLRTETAALFAVAAVQIVLQEKEAWRIHR